MTRIYSSDQDFERAVYWREVKSDLVLTPVIASIIFVVALFSLNLATMALFFDVIYWVFGKFSKSGFRMKFPAFAIAMAFNFMAIFVAAKFF